MSIFPAQFRQNFKDRLRSRYPCEHTAKTPLNYWLERLPSLKNVALT